MPKRILKGTVISDKADKTLTVKVERRFTDPFFKKTVRSSKKPIIVIRVLDMFRIGIVYGLVSEALKLL